MLRVTMLRHGKTYGNTLGRYIGITNEPLLTKEREDLKAYGFEGMDAVFASPMKRCMETAEILFPGLSPIVIPSFRECDFGDFENKNYQELKDNKDYQAWVDSGGKSAFPNGEDIGAFQNRCLEGFDELVKMAYEKEWNEVAMVVHGGTIMAVLGAYGFPRQDYFNWQVKNGEGYRVRFQAEAYLSGSKELVVDGRIVRKQEE